MENEFVRQISVFLENKPATVTRCVQVLADASVDLRAMSIADTQDYGILRCIVSDTDRATKVLESNHYLYRLDTVIAAAIPDEPGGLNQVLSLLGGKGINVEYLYAFVTGIRGSACVVLRTQDAQGAAGILKENGVVLYNEIVLQNL